MKTQVRVKKRHILGKVASGCQYSTGGTNVIRTRHNVTVYVYDLSC